ncbi:hypothetical protein PROFUN_08707 [Planoprotostelium fungivorum]|uniref:Uncharacterized protein n=1 Tax=Planoprotostelium fungivorum TaxID=1890364 RepID=A0A2P6MQV3_9EUKA|nr:hypothetical protein PROFUN_08707 [Planoprotostelium fungivorum]
MLASLQTVSNQAHQELRWMEQHIKKMKLSPDSLDSMVQQRLQNKPIQYILGDVPFGPLNIKVRQPVLIPRAETEFWTNQLIDTIKTKFSPTLSRRPLNILDIAACMPSSSVNIVGVDLNRDAVQLSTENLQSADTLIHNHVSFVCDDVLEQEFPSKEGGEGRVEQSVLRYEDPLALIGTGLGPHREGDEAIDDGLDFYRRISRIRRDLVHREHLVALEVGEHQADKYKSERAVVYTE